MAPQSKTVLVVEDEAPLRKALTQKCRAHSWKVLEAVDGVEGLKIATRDKPDCILLDVLMPRKDGLTMLTELRASGDYGLSVPVVVLTNVSSEKAGIMEKIAETEPSFYLIKSDVTLESVIEKIESVVTVH